MRFTIWQCTDWCCEEKPHGKRWWNVAIAPGSYESLPTFDQALASTRDVTMWARFRRWAA